LDLATSRAVARHTNRKLEEALRLITWSADERVLGIILGGLWLASRGSDDVDWRRDLDHLALCVVVTGMLPHIFKRVIDRERPNRRFPLRRHFEGVPKAGRAYDSFPSGHTMHLGALAPAISRMAPQASTAVWAVSIGVASSRVFLLAHWLTDAVIGFVGGVVIERLLRRGRKGAA
jgi:membrane-associated phospholipid phosphatase